MENIDEHLDYLNVDLVKVTTDVQTYHLLKDKTSLKTKELRFIDLFNLLLPVYCLKLDD